MALTQDQADALYLEQRAAEMQATKEMRIVNWVQGIFALLGIILIIRKMLNK